MKSCRVCKTQSFAVAPRGWTTEAFLRQDAKGKKLVVELHLCERCTAYVKNTLGEPRLFLGQQVPPGLVPARPPAKTRPRR